MGCIFPTYAQEKRLPYPTDTVDGKIYYLYTVERSIGLYRISLNFGVTQEDILQANPHLQHQGLRFEEVIRIPSKQTVTPQKSTPIANKKQTRQEKRNRLVRFDNDSNNTHIDTLVLTDTIHQDSLINMDSTTIRLAYLLPLHTDVIKRDKNMERFYDFYAGSLIAIYEAQARGLHLDIYTYDIGKNAQRTKEVITNHPEIRQADAIIGPAYSQQVSVVIDSLRQDSIWCLIPFLSRVSGFDTNKCLIKFNPSEQVEADTLARYLAQRKDSVHCVLIEAKKGEIIPTGITAIHKALQQYEVPTSSISLKALLTDSIAHAFYADKENIIIFNTERYANLQAVMPHLITASTRYRTTLFSHYSWQNEKIVLPQLFTSIFTPTPTIPDTYQQLFEEYFNHELSSLQPRYDLLGYDLTSQLIHMLTHVNDTTGLWHMPWIGTQANIHYVQTTPQSGYENQTIHIIHQ